MKKIANIFSKTLRKNKKKIPQNKITIDTREKNSLVPSYLEKENQIVEYKQLQIGDYLINNIIIERKTFQDLQSSIINKRIFSQLNEIKKFPSHFLIIEGKQKKDNTFLNPNALKGFLLSVITDYKIPIIYTKNEKETALYLTILAKKSKDKSLSKRISRNKLSKREQSLFILEGFPGIGPKTAEKLLKEFKSLNKIFQSNEDSLKPLLGKKTQQFLEQLR